MRFPPAKGGTRTRARAMSKLLGGRLRAKVRCVVFWPMQRIHALVVVAALCGCEKKSGTASPEEGELGQGSADPVRAEMSSAPKQEVDTTVRIEGGLTESQVQATVDEHFDEVRGCFDEAMARMEMDDLSGVIAIQMTVDKSGKVTLSQVDATNFGDAEAADCIVEQTKTWTFPKLKKGPTAKVIYPFQLRSY